ncbi:MAG: hypothetical protein ACM3UX_00570 [Candidatus Woesearchaeota archaeon]
MKSVRWLTGLAFGIGLAGCGGAHHDAVARPAANLTAHDVPPPSLALVLPASADGPTTCTVYESGFAAQVVFDSQSLNVSGECQAWTSRQPGAGYLWAYQPIGASIATTAVRVCGLEDPSGRVTATVVEDAGWAPVSALERVNLAKACASLAAAGWERQASAGR